MEKLTEFLTQVRTEERGRNRKHPPCLILALRACNVSAKQIAESLEVSEDTVKDTIAEARRQVSDAFPKLDVA